MKIRSAVRGRQNISAGVALVLALAAISVCPAGEPEQRLSVEAVCRLALARNADIAQARYQAYSARQEQVSAAAVYDTRVSAEMGYADSRLASVSSVFGTPQTRAQFGVAAQRTFSTGTALSFSLDDTRTAGEAPFTAFSAAHDARLGVALRQPLLNDGFGQQTRGRQDVARLSAEEAAAAARSRIEQLLAQTQQSYWRLALAGAEAALAREMEEKAHALLALFKDKQRLGLVELPELWSAQALTAARAVESLQATLDITYAWQDLARLIGSSVADAAILPADLADTAGPALVDPAASRKTALARRPEALQASYAVERAGTQAQLAENAALPELEAIVSWTRNGVAAGQGQAWRDIGREDNNELFGGLRLSFFWENRRASAGAAQSYWHYQQALTRLRQVREDIAAQVDTAVAAVTIRQQQVASAIQAARSRAEQLQAEEQRFEAGRSSGDAVIRAHEAVLTARRVVAASWYAYRLSVIALRLAQGSVMTDAEVDYL